MPVASAQLIDGRFQIMNEGQTVKDVKTNLIWTRCSVGQEFKDNVCSGSADAMSIYKANKLLAVLNADSGFAGARNWRMPTLIEWADLRDCSKGTRETSTSESVFGKKITKEKTISIPTNRGNVAVPSNCPLSAIKEAFLNPPSGRDPYLTSIKNNNSETYILGDLWVFWYSLGGFNTLDMDRDDAYVRFVRNAN